MRTNTNQLELPLVSRWQYLVDAPDDGPFVAASEARARSMAARLVGLGATWARVFAIDFTKPGSARLLDTVRRCARAA